MKWLGLGYLKSNDWSTYTVKVLAWLTTYSCCVSLESSWRAHFCGSLISHLEWNSLFRKILRTVCRPGRKNQGREVVACVAPPIFGCLSSSAHLIHGNSSFEATPTTLHLCPSLNSPCSPEQSCLTMLFPGTGFSALQHRTSHTKNIHMLLFGFKNKPTPSFFMGKAEDYSHILWRISLCISCVHCYYKRPPNMPCCQAVAERYTHHAINRVYWRWSSYLILKVNGTPSQR